MRHFCCAGGNQVTNLSCRAIKLTEVFRPCSMPDVNIQVVALRSWATRRFAPLGSVLCGSEGGHWRGSWVSASQGSDKQKEDDEAVESMAATRMIMVMVNIIFLRSLIVTSFIF